jgi:hypothetical protein
MSRTWGKMKKIIRFKKKDRLAYFIQDNHFEMMARRKYRTQIPRILIEKDHICNCPDCVYFRTPPPLPIVPLILTQYIEDFDHFESIGWQKEREYKFEPRKKEIRNFSQGAKYFYTFYFPSLIQKILRYDDYNDRLFNLDNEKRIKFFTNLKTTKDIMKKLIQRIEITPEEIHQLIEESTGSQRNILEKILPPQNPILHTLFDRYTIEISYLKDQLLL